MDEIATNTASNTEENVQSASDSSTIDPTAVGNPEVGPLDTFLSQNIYENPGEIDESTNISQKAIPEVAENTLSFPDNGPSNRPKRSVKPTEKSIENRLQSDQAKLDKLWRNTTNAVTKLQETPDSVDQIKSHTSEVRSLFHQYHAVSLALLEYLVGLSDPQHRNEYETLQKLTNNRSQYIQTAINEANERKKELLHEINSSRHSRSSRSSVASSTTARALARAEATAALKKVQLQKWRSLRESQAALEIQQEEIALAQKKMKEKARMETLRLEEEAVVAVTKAQAIDKELSLEELQEPEHISLPQDDPVQRAQQYVNSQLFEEPDFDQDPPPRVSNHVTSPQHPKNINHLVQEQPPNEGLNTKANIFTPQPQTYRTDPNTETMSSYIQFMARRELIANKIQKFDDNPKNYSSWRESFRNMIRDINITPQEELSLIIEYTSNESKKLAQRLRSAYINKPTEGVAVLWQKLGQRFGSNAVLTEVHLNKLRDFPKVGYRDNKKLQELGDLLLELQCAKADGGLSGLRILDEPTYIKPVIAKLPGDIQGRWQKHAYSYKKKHPTVDYPPFTEFATFIQELALERNDPNLMIEFSERRNTGLRNTGRHDEINVKKTGVEFGDQGNGHNPPPRSPTNWCIVHHKPHPLSKCRAFLAKPLDEKTRILRENRVCFRCIASCDHFAKDCKAKIACAECKSDKHLAALHVQVERKNGGEHRENQEQPGKSGQSDEITAKCTEVCGTTPGSKSCSKICLANVYVRGHPQTKVKAYVVIDDQSNSSLAKPELFDRLNLHGQTTSYSLRTCAGTSQIQGRCSRDLIVESLDGSKSHQLSSVIECDAIPDSREEIPTPEVARVHPHLREIAYEIPEVCDDADILLLVGRNAPPLQKIHESRNGSRNAPWAQRLDLGWVIIGNACLDGAHKPTPSCYKTNILESGRPSMFSPCPNRLYLKENPPNASSLPGNDINDRRKETFEKGKFDDGIGAKVFLSSKDDNKPGQSIEDRRFISIMDSQMVKNDAGNWEAPLPFREPISQLPDNREDTLKRFNSTKRTLDRQPEMKKHYFEFMHKLFENGHAEPVPPSDVDSKGPRWYLPHFGVYHPRKPGKIRIVFDSAAETHGVSLNKLLLSGPDLTNSLLGILLRFRCNTVAFMTDIEQMFHSFMVREDHRDFLRFFWYKDNNPEEEVKEYRMKVHIFGNTSSPAVATCGLRKTALVGESEYGPDAREFVENDFYVDDGIKSVPNCEEAIDLLRRTKAMLATANLRLHKIASNNPKVTQAFPVEDQASDLRNLDLHQDAIPIQRSLGVFWDLQADVFTFQVADEVKPFTRRGVLSVTNSLYDPLGIAAPVIIKAKILLRAMTTSLKRHPLDHWDKPLPEQYRSSWEAWCKSLSDLTEVKVPRAYTTVSLSEASRVEIHTFCDASVEAIAAVSYLKVVLKDGQVQVSFLFGKAKLAPTHATTIPRLELCAAVLGVEVTELAIEVLTVQPHSVTYYTDSKVTLGYILNETRRFYVYVGNRVQRIRRSSRPDQWRYVATDINPADLATRSVKACDLKDSTWLAGPTFLQTQSSLDAQADVSTFKLPEKDPELRPEITTLITETKPEVHRNLGTARFLRFSRWSNLVNAVSKLILFALKQRHRYRHTTEVAGNNPQRETTVPITVVEARKRAQTLIIRNVQYESFREEIDCLERKKGLPKTSSLLKLSPIVDCEGLLRVGGRLERADLPYEERHPLILPGKHHVTNLLVQNCHEDVEHQGRHFTHGNVRSKGFWIVGGKCLVNRVIHQCLKCKKLRGKLNHQKMADLPIERLTPSPPFTYVGLDVFGPWEVTARRTRGGHAYSKRWAVLFTCLSTRAIHIELIESMDTSSFINALRRFKAIRGPVKQIRSDCGTNFTGAHNELGAAVKEMDQQTLDAYLNSQECQWIFNPPHASHCGGVWERMIGISRRILDSMLDDLKPTRLTHEALSTLMAEVTAIVNNRPLVAVSSDPSAPEILTPSTLLTQKSPALKSTPGNFVPQDLYTKQWRQVQYLANRFWSRWRKEFLPCLQSRRKWEETTPDLKVGDLVLLRCKDAPRNNWPLARISKAINSADGKVRKVEVMTAKNGSKQVYTRPVTEVILLKTERELNLLPK